MSWFLREPNYILQHKPVFVALLKKLCTESNKILNQVLFWLYL